MFSGIQLLMGFFIIDLSSMSVAFLVNMHVEYALKFTGGVCMYIRILLTDNIISPRIRRVALFHTNKQKGRGRN